MDHHEMERRGTTEQYLLGGLDEKERAAFEEHFFDCAECAADVRAGATFLAVAQPLLEDEHAVEPAAPRAFQQPASRPGFGRHRALMASLSSLAAVLCLAAYQGLVVIPRLQKEVQTLDGLRAVPSYFLTVARSETPTVSVLPSDRQVVLTLSQSWDRAFPAYRCELQDGGGRALLSATVPSRTPKGELEVLLPTGQLATGSYVLIVEGVDTNRGAEGPGAPVARYPFHFERR